MCVCLVTFYGGIPSFGEQCGSYRNQTARCCSFSAELEACGAGLCAGVLSPGGALFGDDYSEGTSGVAKAVKDGAAQLATSFRVEGRYWVLERPVS